MSTAFDSEVYAERQRLPGAAIDLTRLLRALLSLSNVYPDQPQVSLILEYRPDVDTSHWWTLRWGGGNEISAKELELCLFRAAVLARQSDERARRYAGMAPPAWGDA